MHTHPPQDWRKRVTLTVAYVCKWMPASLSVFFQVLFVWRVWTEHLYFLLGFWILELLFIETFITLISQVLHYTGCIASMLLKFIPMFSKDLCVCYMVGLSSLQWPARELNSYISFGFPILPSQKNRLWFLKQ